MKISPRLILSFLLLSGTVTFQFTGCSSKDPDVSAFQITPDNGPYGTLVTITGTGFGEDETKDVVKFNGVIAADIQVATPTQIVVVAPRAKTGAVTVTVGTNTITGPVFTYTAPVVTKSYFFKFKVGGEDIVFETGNPGFEGCGQCSCVGIPPLSSGDGAGMSVCYSDHGSTTAALIQGLKGQTIPFDNGAYSQPFPFARFNTKLDGVSYGTFGVTQPASSKVTVTDVVEDGNYSGFKSFKVTGTVNCKLADKDKNTIDVVEGTFSVRFTEGF